MKCLVLSCGGTPQALIISINKIQPDKIIFFSSRETTDSIATDILPQINKPIEEYKIVETQDAQSLMVSFKTVYREIPDIVDSWGIDWKDVIVDNTGGTKIMSSVLALALIDKVSSFSYVGSRDIKSRTKEGVGIVADGKEFIYSFGNPWEEMARDKLMEINILYSKARYETALDVLRSILKKVDTDLKPYLSAMDNILQSIIRWDNFQYSNILNTIPQGLSLLNKYYESHPNKSIKVFIDQFQDLNKIGESIKNEYEILTKDKQRVNELPEDHYYLIKDLISNAMRRADLEGKYEDAVARLYSALEKTFKIRLLQKFSIDNSHVEKHQLKGELIQKFAHKDNEEDIQLAFYDSADLLHALEDPIGLTYKSHYAELKNVMGIRNQSYLAHGFTVVKKKTYDNLLDITLKILGINHKDLHHFPNLPRL